VVGDDGTHAGWALVRNDGTEDATATMRVVCGTGDPGSDRLTPPDHSCGFLASAPILRVLQTALGDHHDAVSRTIIERLRALG
jgi:hypothetical protein